ncbi:MAG: tetratricopeptide repeat protein [Spirochaetaceae bacterium]
MHVPSRPLIILLAISLVLLLSSCATGGESQAASVTVEGDPDSALAFSLQTAAAVPDVFTRSLLYTRIAEAYIEVGLILPATSVLERAVRLADTEVTGEARAEVFAQLAFPFISLGRMERARTLLNRALEESEGARETVRGVVLQEVINASFIAGEELFDVLVRAVDQVYIISDLPSRVSLLTDIARQYQDSGLGQQVNTLVQQALSAVGGMRNPLQRAQGFAAVARRFHVAGNTEQAALHVSRALREIENAQALGRSQDDAAILLQVSADFSGMGRLEEAEQVVETIDFPGLYARGLAELGSRYLDSDQPAEAQRLFDAAVNFLALDGNDAQLADVITDVAERLLEAGQNTTAEQNAEVALLVIRDVDDEFTRSDVLRRLGRLFVRAGRTDLALEAADALPDRAQEARLLIAIALESLNREEAAEAFAIASDAQSAGLLAEYQTDEISAELVELFARLGLYEEAIEQLDQIVSPLVFGQALVEIGRYSLRAGGLTEEETVMLQAMVADISGIN